MIERLKMPDGILSLSMCNVNEITTKKCTKSKNFEDLEISDVLENIKLLLNYIKKKKLKGASLMRRGARARVGGVSTY